MAREVFERVFENLEQSVPADRGVQNLSMLAGLSARFWRAVELNLLLEGYPKLWPIYNSPLELYEEDFETMREWVPSIEDSIREIITRKGQAVVLLVGANDNIFAPLQQQLKEETNQEHPLVVIHIGLLGFFAEDAFTSGRRSDDYHLGTPFGTTQAFEQIHTLLEMLHKEGVVHNPNIDGIVTRLIRGGETIPGDIVDGKINLETIRLTIMESSDELFKDFGQPNREEKQYAKRLICSINRLPRERGRELFRKYLIYLGQQLYQLVQDDFFVYGETNEALSSILDEVLDSSRFFQDSSTTLARTTEGFRFAFIHRK